MPSILSSACTADIGCLMLEDRYADKEYVDEHIEDVNRRLTTIETILDTKQDKVEWCGECACTCEDEDDSFEEEEEKEKTMNSKFKIGDIVTVKKIGEDGSDFLDWNHEGEMDKYDDCTAMVSDVEIDFAKESVLNAIIGHGKPVEYAKYKLSRLTGPKGIEEWTFGEDNLTLAPKVTRNRLKAMCAFGIDRVIYQPQLGKVIVKFCDGDTQVSICKDGDTYDAEKGLLICLLRRLTGESRFLDLMKQDEPVKSEPAPVKESKEVEDLKKEINKIFEEAVKCN